MSRLIDMELECPSCGFAAKRSVYASANVTLEPGLRAKIFQDELNRFTCPECESVSIAGVSLMYHDMLRRFAVWFCPQGPIPEWYLKRLEDMVMRNPHMDYLVEAEQTFAWNEFKAAIETRENELAGAGWIY
jgi:predicted RNA-binding Zn-ribbon protein involved in translation (DUF1610 family)